MPFAELAYLKITERNTRKQTTLGQRPAREECRENGGTVLKVVNIMVAEKILKEQNLKDDIDDVETLDREIEADQRSARTSLTE